MRMAGSRFVWHDLVTPDVEAAKRFYAELFGWTYDAWDAGGVEYPMITVEGRHWGGIVDSDEGQRPHWLGYLSLDDVDAATELARSLGGMVAFEPEDIPEVGRCSVVADPSGAVFAPFSARGEGPTYPERTPPGGFAWDELLSTDVDAAVAFYRAVVGWDDTVAEMHGIEYHLLGDGTPQVAGAMAMPPEAEAGSHWLPYVAVEDADAAAARLERLGGRNYTGMLDVQDVGRFASCADPQGAPFAFIQPAP
jgi:predicted enzyme related to lactoylglutathione lyase